MVVYNGVWHHTRNHVTYFLKELVRTESRGRQVWIGRSYNSKIGAWTAEREFTLTISFLRNNKMGLPAPPAEDTDKPRYVTRRREHIDDVMGATITGRVFGRDIAKFEEALKAIETMSSSGRRMFVVGLQRFYLANKGKVEPRGTEA